MQERALGELRSLAARDEALAARAAELREHDDHVASIRRRAETIDAYLTAYPAEHEARRLAVEHAEQELARRRAGLAAAEAAVPAADDPEVAEKAVARGRDHVDVAAATLGRAQAACAELEARGAELRLALAALEGEAGVEGTDELVEWSAARHAELFVELGQLDQQRERVIREATELASMLLGEPTYGSTVAQVLARVER